MDEEPGEERLRKTEQANLDSRNALRRETETPMTQVLSPEAREDAQKVAKEIITESEKLLGDQERVVRVDPNKVKGNLIISGKEEVDKTIFQGASIGMSRHTFDNHPDGRQDSIQELWHFYPDHVVKTIRHDSLTSSGERLQPKGLATEKVEADRDELGTLLEDIKTSAPFVPHS